MLRPHLASRLASSAALLGAASLAAASAAAATSPAQLYSASLAAARGQTSVHYVASQTSSGRGVRIAGDAARDRGIQRITYRNGSRVGHVTVLVVANTAYVRGDAFTLTHYMGIPAAAAAGWAGRWLSLARTAPDYAPVAEAVRLQSTLDELKMPPPLQAVGSATKRGRRVLGLQSRFVRGGRRVAETLWVEAGRVPLPVEQTGRSGAITTRTTFSRWNERVAVAAPRNAIPIR